MTLSFESTTETYYLKVVSPGKIVKEACSLEIESTHFLVHLVKQEPEKWRALTASSNFGLTFQRRLDKEESEAEKQLWVRVSSFP
jgi:hypothetical protein